jgi:hypothetical protein
MLLIFKLILLSDLYFGMFVVAERPRTGMELLVDGLSKAGKKRLDKLNRINIHLHGE